MLPEEWHIDSFTGTSETVGLQYPQYPQLQYVSEDTRIWLLDIWLLDMECTLVWCYLRAFTVILEQIEYIDGKKRLCYCHLFRNSTRVAGRSRRKKDLCFVWMLCHSWQLRQRGIWQVMW